MVLIDHLMENMCTLTFYWNLYWTWWVLRNDCWIFCLDLHRLLAKAVLSTTLFAILGLANCLVRWKLKSPCVNLPHWWYKYFWLYNLDMCKSQCFCWYLLMFFEGPRKIQAQKRTGFVIVFLSVADDVKPISPSFFRRLKPKPTSLEEAKNVTAVFAQRPVFLVFFADWFGNWIGFSCWCN